eukprot:GHVT01089754.1.p1 GENE.GHVT01089754.1~~GHVT01089754.1.p1  ORF type:complete len:1031 (-),score=170.96 GHVT01089754.1:919-4011(-)
MSDFLSVPFLVFTFAIPLSVPRCYLRSSLSIDVFLSLAPGASVSEPSTSSRYSSASAAYQPRFTWTQLLAGPANGEPCPNWALHGLMGAPTGSLLPGGGCGSWSSSLTCMSPSCLVPSCSSLSSAFSAKPTSSSSAAAARPSMPSCGEKRALLVDELPSYPPALTHAFRTHTSGSISPLQTIPPSMPNGPSRHNVDSSALPQKNFATSSTDSSASASSRDPASVLTAPLTHATNTSSATAGDCSLVGSTLASAVGCSEAILSGSSHRVCSHCEQKRRLVFGPIFASTDGAVDVNSANGGRNQQRRNLWYSQGDINTALDLPAGSECALGCRPPESAVSVAIDLLTRIVAAPAFSEFETSTVVHTSKTTVAATSTTPAPLCVRCPIKIRQPLAVRFISIALWPSQVHVVITNQAATLSLMLECIECGDMSSHDGGVGLPCVLHPQDEFGAFLPRARLSSFRLCLRWRVAGGCGPSSCSSFPLLAAVVPPDPKLQKPPSCSVHWNLEDQPTVSPYIELAGNDHPMVVAATPSALAVCNALTSFASLPSSTVDHLPTTSLWARDRDLQASVPLSFRLYPPSHSFPPTAASWGAHCEPASRLDVLRVGQEIVTNLAVRNETENSIELTLAVLVRPAAAVLAAVEANSHYEGSDVCEEEPEILKPGTLAGIFVGHPDDARGIGSCIWDPAAAFTTSGAGGGGSGGVLSPSVFCKQNVRPLSRAEEPSPVGPVTVETETTSVAPLRWRRRFLRIRGDWNTDETSSGPKGEDGAPFKQPLHDAIRQHFSLPSTKLKNHQNVHGKQQKCEGERNDKIDKGASKHNPVVISGNAGKEHEGAEDDEEDADGEGDYVEEEKESSSRRGSGKPLKDERQRAATHHSQERKHSATSFVLYQGNESSLVSPDRKDSETTNIHKLGQKPLRGADSSGSPARVLQPNLQRPFEDLHRQPRRGDFFDSQVSNANQSEETLLPLLPVGKLQHDLGVLSPGACASVCEFRFLALHAGIHCLPPLLLLDRRSGRRLVATGAARYVTTAAE